MIKISIMYPYHQVGRFDLPYYLAQHMPRSIKLLGIHPGFRGVSVERGLSAAIPDTKATYIASCHYWFDTVENFLAAFLPHAQILQEDRVNYTDLEPVIQFSEVLLSNLTEGFINQGDPR